MKTNHLRLIIIEDEYVFFQIMSSFSDLAMRHEEDILNCLYLILSLPISYSGYLPRLLDLVIECIGHKSNQIVIFSLFVMIKYYQYELSDKQTEHLYNLLFSLITTSHNNEIVVLIAYLLSLLPHYHLLTVAFFSSDQS